jgi:hypothetical protein
MNEYFSQTADLTPFGPDHYYLDWPAFYLLNEMATSLVGINLINFEFILYTILGILLSSSMYIYVTKAQEQNGFLAVVSSFIIMFPFFNFQCVPFTFAFALVFLLFALEAQEIKNLKTPFTILIFITIALTHSFVATFYILYLFIRYMFHRDRNSLNLFTLTITIYLAVLLFQAELSFKRIIELLISLPPGYGQKIATTIETSSVPIDNIAQMFSRLVVVGTALLCFTGFIFLCLKRGIRLVDKAVLVSGAIYIGIGGIVQLLGLRALPLVVVPISLGATYLIKDRIGQYLKYLFLAMILLFVFVPIHSSFNDSQIFFQTEEAYQTENFMIDHYDVTVTDHILAHIRVVDYLRTKEFNSTNYENDFSHLFPNIGEYNCIVYTIGLGKNLLSHNYTSEKMLSEAKLNVVYSGGLSYIAVESSD